MSIMLPYWVIGLVFLFRLVRWTLRALIGSLLLLSGLIVTGAWMIYRGGRLALNPMERQLRQIRKLPEA